MSKKKNLSASKGKIARNEKGQFPPGVSGNLNGRPPTEPKLPPDFGTCLASMLAEEVPMTGSNGALPATTYYLLLCRSLLHSAIKGKTREQILFVELALRVRAFDIMIEQAQEEAEPQPVFSEEDRRLLASIGRGMEASRNIPNWGPGSGHD